MSAIAALLLLTLAAPPDTLAPPPSAAAPAPGPVAQLAYALAQLGAKTPLQARVEHRVSFQTGDDEKPPPEGVATVTASSGPEGLQVTWSPSLLARADREEQERNANPAAATPTRDAVADLRALSLARALDAVPELLLALRDAELLEDRMESFYGSPTRVLLLSWKPTIAARDRKYVKEIEATAKIWLGRDGLPLAVERHVLVKGRIFLIITFEIEQSERVRLRRIGDRLLAVRTESDFKSSGAGERRDRLAVTTLTPVE
jgi:hypothetical protein